MAARGHRRRRFRGRRQPTVVDRRRRRPRPTCAGRLRRRPPSNAAIRRPLTATGAECRPPPAAAGRLSPPRRGQPPTGARRRRPAPTTPTPPPTAVYRCRSPAPTAPRPIADDRGRRPPTMSGYRRPRGRASLSAAPPPLFLPLHSFAAPGHSSAHIAVLAMIARDALTALEAT